MGDHIRWAGLWNQHGGVHGLGFWGLSGYKTLGTGCGSNVGEGVGQLALEDASSNGVGYLGGGVALSEEAVKGVLFLRQVQDFMVSSMRIGAVNVFEDNEGAIKLAVNKHAASRRTKHIDVKHHLVRDACDAGKVRVVYVGMEDHQFNM